MINSTLQFSPELIHWKEQGDYFNYQGLSIFYRYLKNESKPKLLLIHGYPTSSWDWHKIWPALATRFELITLDMLGYGFSDKPYPFDYRIGIQADVIQALLAKLNINSVHILCHDYGDTVAQELLARNNESDKPFIKSIVLLNGGLFPETHRAVFIQKLLISPVGPIVANLASYDRFANNMNHICKQPLSKEELADHWRLIQYNSGKKGLAKLIRYMEERKQHRTRWVAALSDFSGSMALINGVDDPVSGEHMVKRFEELIPQANVIRLQNVGHYPQLEAPEAVFNAFLKVREDT